MRRPQNWEKSSTCFTKQLFLHSSVKTSGRFFKFLCPSQKSLTLTQWILVLIILNLSKTRRHGYNLHLESKEFPLTVQHFRQNEKMEQTDRELL